MSSAQNDRQYKVPPVAEVVAGFEVAVADYERGQSVLDEARYRLDRMESQLEYAKLTLNESDAHLEVAVMKYNSTPPDDPQYHTLLAEMDLASDTMLRNSERYELAVAQYRFALEKFESELATSRETFDVANSLCGELIRSVGDDTNREASNDPHYHGDSALQDLSDAAYRFYRESA